MAFIQGLSCTWKQSFCAYFLSKFCRLFWWNFICCHGLLVCWSPCQIYFSRTLFNGENFTQAIFFIKNTLSNGSRSGAYEPISFKFGVMLDTTKVHNLTSVWMTLTFIQSHKMSRKLYLVRSIYFKVARSRQKFLNVPQSYYFKGDDPKPWPSFKVTRCRESYTLCDQSISKWHEADKSFWMSLSLIILREMTPRKNWKYGEYGLPQHFALLVQPRIRFAAPGLWSPNLRARCETPIHTFPVCTSTLLLHPFAPPSLTPFPPPPPPPLPLKKKPLPSTISYLSPPPPLLPDNGPSHLCTPVSIARLSGFVHH